MAFKTHKIEDLIDPSQYQEPLKVDTYEKEFLMHLLERMLIIRLSEDKLAEERKEGAIGGPVHLSAGQEAIAVGIAKNLNSNDRVFGAHRSHSHLLSMNPLFYKLFAEVLGKDTGFSKGMGGSMHLTDKDSGFYGSVPIVSGTVPLAVGAAFEAKRSGQENVGVAYIGDGAVEEGVVQESLNLASILNSPTVFVVENNLFASHMNISLRQPKQSTCRFGQANNIESVLLDGNNVLEVFEVSKKLIQESRSSGSPCFIECLTFRQYGHVDWRKDIDVGVDRTEKDLDAWLKRDPITRLIKGMQKDGLIDNKEFNELNDKIVNEIDVAWKKATEDPFPPKEALLERVYSNGK